MKTLGEVNLFSTLATFSSQSLLNCINLAIIYLLKNLDKITYLLFKY